MAGVKHALWTDPLGNTHNYFFSWLHQPTSTLEVDWLDARNICRRHCMDAVSLETLQENEFIKQQLARCRFRQFFLSLFKKKTHIKTKSKSFY